MIPKNDEGTSLVEVLIVGFLLALIGALAAGAVITSSQATDRADDEARGLADVRFVTERLSRDLRDARQVDAGADGDRLVLWVDYDSNYARATDGSEDVTWSLVASASAGHYDVFRQRGTGSDRKATTLVDDIAFRYDAHPAGTVLTAGQAAAVRLVTVSMRYDAVLARATGQREVVFSARLRNVS